MRDFGLSVTAVIIFLCISQTVQAADLYVGPGETYVTIQPAIDDANDGDRVIIRDGTYTGAGNKNLNFGGKLITVKSENGPETCIIDCQDDGRGFIFQNGEGSSSVVSGFTIKNGYIYEVGVDSKGGGIYCSGASPVIDDCIITNNTALGARVDPFTAVQHAYGGGIYCDGASPVIQNCIITNNIAQGARGIYDSLNHENNDGHYGSGGGIYCISGSNPVIINSVITNNTARGGDGMSGGGLGGYHGIGGNSYGGGIYFSSNSNPTIENCVIADNAALAGDEGAFSGSTSSGRKGGDSFGAGIYCGIDSIATITNCLITENEAKGGNGQDATEHCSGGGDGGNAYGGGVGIYAGSECAIEQCTIAGNITIGGIGGSGGPAYIWCTEGGADGDPGTENGAGVFIGAGCSADIGNSIIWTNVGDEIYGAANANYSDIEGGYAGPNNIIGNPYFVSGPEGNYYLSQAAAGQGINSPCVGAGSDLAANLGMNIFTTRADEMSDKGQVDMGYHYPVDNPFRADINKDYSVDLFDFDILGWQFVDGPNEPTADIELPVPDGDVDIWDLWFLASQWLECYVKRVSDPNPAEGSLNLDPDLVLSWSEAEGATFYDVYLGTDANLVVDADILSDEFIGTVNDTNFDACGLLEFSTEYFWRVDAVGAGCIIYGNIWKFTIGSGKATNPSPSTSTINVDPYVILSWTSGGWANSHDVYFGTDFSAVSDANELSAEFMGNQVGVSYDPCIMEFEKTYYWRIDEKSDLGTVKGDVWEFATLSGGVTNPVPADKAVNVSPDIVLNCTPGWGANSYDVYFGTDFNAVNGANELSAEFMGNQVSGSYDPCITEFEKTYYWRIDERSDLGTVKGDVWEFTTLSGNGTNPSPSTFSVNRDPNLVLGWASGWGANSHDVYFGTDFNTVSEANELSLEFMGNQILNSYDPCGLDYNTPYYWRIDERSDLGTTKGDVWSFETAGDASLIGVVGYWSFDEGTGSVANDMAGNNHGTITGAQWTSGKVGGALDFDGSDDYVQVSDDASLDFSDEFTLSAWVRPGVVDVHGRVIYRYEGESAYFLTLVPTAEGRWAFYVLVGGVSVNVQSDNAPAVNEWSLITATRSVTGELKLYVNGVLQSDIKTHAGAIAPNADLFIGVDYVLNNEFTGDIDEVQIYDRALSGAEVLSLYQAAGP